jgi:predicted GNAT family N-acyltransferase
MMNTEYHVQPVAWRDAEHALRRIRQIVFIEEQGVPQELEWDGLDAESSHVIAYDSTGEVVGSGRLLPSGQIGRMAVLAQSRRRGVGTRLLQALLERAKEKNMPRVFLHAQCDAIPFYQKQGFRVVGGVFMEAGIAHQTMERLL